MNRWIATVVSVVAAASSGAWAQDTGTGGQAPGGVVPGQGPMVPGVAPAVSAEPLPASESLVRRDAAGKVVRIRGVLDVHALLRNSLITPEVLQRARPHVEEWAADINQLAIDNLDFLEEIEEQGLIETFDFNDRERLSYLSQITVPLISAGPLAKRLLDRGVLTTEQFQRNERIKNEYLQAVLNELMAETLPPGDPMREEGPDEEARKQQQMENINRIVRFLYYTACSDVREAFLSMLTDAAPMAHLIVEDLNLAGEVRAALEPGVAAALAARSDDDRRASVRNILRRLDFDQRRAFLQAAVARGAARNPLDTAVRDISSSPAAPGAGGQPPGH